MKKILITKRLTALVWTLVLTLMPMSLMAENTPLSVTVTFEVGSFVYEQAGNAFDGKPETKWCGGILTTNNTNAYVQVQLAEKSKLDYYYLYTGNDINYKDDDSQQQRNPKEWKLYAKVNEGDEWTLISHVTDAGLPTTVSTRSNNYKIDAAYQNIEYNYLKFEILQIEKGDIFEVGEICFINCNHTFGSDDICTECGYKKQQYDDFVTVASASQMKDALKNDQAKVRLTQDIYMSDLGEGDAGRHTLCSTFKGTLDGNGYTIWAARPEVQHDGGGHYHRQYLFTYCDGATIKNVTFKDFRVQSEDNPNQAIITSQAKNGCVFENITLDHVSVFCNKDNVGAVTGYTDHCTFTNITVKNSDFTTDQHQSGAVVGHAENCTFTNIRVENCESTTDDGKSGGVAGHADYCTISDVEVLGTFVWTNSRYGGGVVGFSEHTSLTNCVVDDQSCVWVDGGFNRTLAVEGDAGGIAGYAGNTSIISNCINSALIACDDNEVGGIVGSLHGNMEDCLNTGLIVSISEGQVKDYYRKYKNKELPCVTKYYKGKEYVVRKTELPKTGDDYYGGIAGRIAYSFVNRCVNIGSMSGTDDAGGIIGEMYGGNVYNCLCDFETPSDKVMGLVGECDYYERSWLSGCVNMSHAKDYDSEIHVSDIFSYSNNSLDNNELKTGKLYQKLSETWSSKNYDGGWEQNLGTDAYPIPSGGKGVYHTRKVTNQYGTVCLPFSVQSDDKISYYSLSQKEEDGQGIKLVFTYNEDRIPEGTPLLFRSAEAKDADADNPVEICINNAGEEFTTTPRNKIFDAGFWDLWGTFEQRVFEDDLAKNIYYVSGGEIRNAKKVTIAPYRAWIYGESIDDLIGSSASQAKSIRFVIEDEDGETLDLELVGDELAPVQQGGKSYSLMGTEVGDGYRGLVIKNGKKVIQNR